MFHLRRHRVGLKMTHMVSDRNIGNKMFRRQTIM